MRYASRIPSLKVICRSKFLHVHFFNHASLSKEDRSAILDNQGPRTKKQSTAENNDSLFNEIIEILGSDNLMLVGNLPGNSVSRGPILGVVEKYGGRMSCTQGVRENAHEKLVRESEMMSVKRDAQMDSSLEDAISVAVHKIAEIVRAENWGISMEEQLDNLGYDVDTDIIEKVLKRCFKVPHMTMRFFNWAKLRSRSCLSTEIYNTMLYIAGEAKEFELVEKLLEEMEEYKCDKDVKTWTILFMHYGKAKLIGKALLVFEKMRTAGCAPDAEAYSWMIRVLCAAGKGEIAFEFYKEMVQKDLGQGLDIKLYKLLLNCLAASGDIAGLYSVANDMMKVSQIPEQDVYLCVLKSFCIFGRIAEALKLIRDLKCKDLTFNPEYFETLVKGLCRANRIDDALEIVGIMEKRDVVNEKVYGAIISGYLRKNDLSKALKLFHDMKESRKLPSTSTYTELTQHHFNLNEYQEGCALFNEMLEKGVELDSVAFMAMVAGHVRQNCISLAWKVFQSMEDMGISANQKSYLIFIKELCKISRTDEIFKVLNKMRDSKVTIRDEIFHVVISYLERRGEIVKAEEVKKMQRCCRLNPLEGESSCVDVSRKELLITGFDHIEPKLECLLLEPLPKAFNDEDLHKICFILSSSKDWCAMEEALENCKVGYTPALVMEIFRNCSIQGSAVLHFFAWVRQQPGYSHTTQTYNMAIKIAGQGKDFKRMRYLFYEMNRNGCMITSNTWTIMIMLYGRVGLTNIALKNFNEMKASGIQPTESTYKYLILSLCGKKGRKVDEAIRLFHEMISAGLVPDKELVESFFDCLCQSGKLSDARRCMHSLRKVGFTVPFAYSLLIRTLCRGGKLEEALVVVDEVKEDRSTLDCYVYGSLVNGLLQMGRLDEALAKVESMNRTGIHPTVHVYTSLIVHFFKNKQVEKALDTFKKMWEEGCKPTIVTYSALICGFMKVGNFVSARNLFRRIKLKGPLPDFKTYSMYITGLCGAGKSEDAMELLSEMLDDGIVPSNINFRTVFFGLNREGKQHLARVVLQQKHALLRKRRFLA
ncbi:hypothetical protein Ancab_000198 [Ancistrocladus abbreviatus]